MISLISQECPLTFHSQVAVSVEEAVKAKLDEYLSQHEEQYVNEFSGIIEELKMQVR